jgi:hypothetical protein
VLVVANPANIGSAVVVRWSTSSYVNCTVALGQASTLVARIYSPASAVVNGCHIAPPAGTVMRSSAF